MEIIGGSSLGPVRADLGRMKSTDQPTIVLVLIGLIPVAGAVLIGAGILFIIRMLWGNDRNGPSGTATAVLAWGLGGLFILGGVIAICVFALRLLSDRAMTVRLHEGGLVIGRSWFRRLQVAWHHVAGISPPEPGAARNEAWLLLRDGRRILIERLSLPSLRDHTGQVIPHPDVQSVIDHYLAWKRSHEVS